MKLNKFRVPIDNLGNGPHMPSMMNVAMIDRLFLRNCPKWLKPTEKVLCGGAQHFFWTLFQPHNVIALRRCTNRAVGTSKTYSHLRFFLPVELKQNWNNTQYSLQPFEIWLCFETYHKHLKRSNLFCKLIKMNQLIGVYIKWVYIYKMLPLSHSNIVLVYSRFQLESIFKTDSDL